MKIILNILRKRILISFGSPTKIICLCQCYFSRLFDQQYFSIRFDDLARDFVRRKNEIFLAVKYVLLFINL